MDDQLLAQASRAAEEVINRNINLNGLAAAADGYPQVWARDSVITFLGAALVGADTMLDAFRHSLESLATGQDRFGQIPYLTWLDGGRCEYGSSDANPWFVIGMAYYVELSGNTNWLQGMIPVLIRALDWCEAQDRTQTDLIISGECDDWADLMPNHGKVLFPNVLYARALEAGASLLTDLAPAEATRFRKRHQQVLTAIQDNFWVRKPGMVHDTSHQQVSQIMSSTLRERPYFLPWRDRFSFGDRFDTTANLLAILTGVATPPQAEAIVRYIVQTGLDTPYPVRVLYPAILPGEDEWRSYFKIYNLNLPHQYHNGGIWPWVGGLYVAALSLLGRRQQAEDALEALAQALQLGETPWECNEWLHGQSGQPMGKKYQAWTAGMFLYARRAVATGQAPGLSTPARVE